MRRGPGRNGFTLIELMVSIAILMTLAVILIPQFTRYNTKEMSNQLAQQIAARLRELHVLSQRTESWTFMDIIDSTHYQVYNQGTTPGGSVTFEATSTAPFDISQDFGRAVMSADGNGVSGVQARVVFGQPNGWVVDPNDTEYSYPTDVYTTIPSKTDANDSPSVKYYPIEIKCGLSDGDYEVRVYQNGKVTVN